ncbi:MAG: DUF29 domain-containing protein [Acetobacteraceae bacterium]
MESPAGRAYDPATPDDLYDRDVLLWSERQADLLRRLARGERVNDVDWAQVVEEIEDVGLSELHAVESYLELVLVHLLMALTWPDSDAVQHWRAEIVAFQSNANRRFAPSMRQRIRLEKIYEAAVEQVSVLEGRSRSVPAPGVCPFTVDQLLNDKAAILEERLRDASPRPTC